MEKCDWSTEFVWRRPEITIRRVNEWHRLVRSCFIEYLNCADTQKYISPNDYLSFSNCVCVCACVRMWAREAGLCKGVTSSPHPPHFLSLNPSTFPHLFFFSSPTSFSAIISLHIPHFLPPSPHTTFVSPYVTMISLLPILSATSTILSLPLLPPSSSSLCLSATELCFLQCQCEYQHGAPATQRGLVWAVVHACSRGPYPGDTAVTLERGPLVTGDTHLKPHTQPHTVTPWEGVTHQARHMNHIVLSQGISRVRDTESGLEQVSHLPACHGSSHWTGPDCHSRVPSHWPTHQANTQADRRTKRDVWLQYVHTNTHHRK